MKTTPWNIQDHLKTDEDRVNYLEAALEEKDRDFIKIALCEIAESLGIDLQDSNTNEPVPAGMSYEFYMEHVKGNCKKIKNN